MKKILRFVLGLAYTAIESVEIADGGSVVIGVRPRKRYARRCPVCHAPCTPYDAGSSPRKWRALDLGAARRFLEYRMTRVERPVHGVHAEDIPWARPNSGFTRAFEDEAAWLSVHCSRSMPYMQLS